MKTNSDRREFLKYGLITSSVFLGSLYGYDKIKNRKRDLSYSGQLIDGSGRGHQLRQAMNLPITHLEKQTVVIVGAGMSGLIAGYYLKKNGFDDFKIIELNAEAGGNSAFGQNEVSKYPWGAHYIPVPNSENKDLFGFLQAMGLAEKSKDSSSIEFKEEYLCQDPQERLLIKGEWQESLLPVKNITQADQDQLNRFHELVEVYKVKKGNDGKFVFNIPLVHSSKDPDYLKLDEISFRDFLISNQLNSEVLNWYANYCVLDDFGMGIDTVSAWAGLHYFCARRSANKGSDHDDHKILTWPQGNGWILEKLVEALKSHIVVNSAVINIDDSGASGVRTRVFNFESKTLTQYESQKVIYAAPQFLVPYILSNKSISRHVTPDDYYSWIVANVTVKTTPEQFRALHWDNVRFQSHSLGYVHARHQELRSHIDDKTVLTLYWPLYEKDHTATNIRKKVSGYSWGDWAQRVDKELESMHSGISTSILSMDIKIYGHAMIGPRVGRIAQVMKQSERDLKNDRNVFFAHTDNSGMSLFEEAFFWGHRIAGQTLKALERV